MMHSAARCHCRFSLVFSADCQRLLSCVRFSVSYPSGDRLGVGSGCAPSLPGMCAILAEDGYIFIGDRADPRSGKSSFLKKSYFIASGLVYKAINI